MKAIICNGPGQPLKLTDRPTPVPQKGEILIKLKAASINHRDLLISKGKYVNLIYPVILGSDGAGIIAELGEDADNHTIGEEVIINPGLLWGDNEYAPGKNYRILGMPDDGCFAEYIVVPASEVFPKPQHLSFEQAAAIPLAGLTGYRALVTKGKVSSREKILITGIGGGVAQIMLQFALSLGAEVYFTSGSDDKIERAIAMGAKGGVNYKNEDWSGQLSTLAGGGFDLIIDSAAGNGFAKLPELANSGGRIVIFGSTSGPLPSLMPAYIYLKQLSILGSSMGSRQDFADMLDLVNEHKIMPVIDEVFPLKQIETAMHKMEQAGQFGKIVLSI